MTANRGVRRRRIGVSQEPVVFWLLGPIPTDGAVL